MEGNETINLEKLITKREMEALIFLAKSRQEYFREIMETRDKSLEKANEMMSTKIEGAGSEISEKMNSIVSKLVSAADQKFASAHKEELAHQDGIIEFLHRFTNEKFEDYSKVFKI